MFEDIIFNLTKQLFPTGRAYRIAEGSEKEKLYKGLAISESKAFEDALAVLNSVLPDNVNFTSDDATDWERRLGMITNPSVLLSDRMLAIARKMASPGVQDAHAHYLYVQAQLQAAGFNVYVYENRFPVYPSGYESLSPLVICGDPSILSYVQHGGVTQHGGGTQHGGYYNNIIANSIDADVDASFNIGLTFRCTFFIGGPTLGSFANVDAAREIEFRELILKSKQVQDIGFLFINYI